MVQFDCTCLPDLRLQVNLGNMYYNGLGVAKDRSKAKEQYRMAAESDSNAKLLLEELEMEEEKERGEQGGRGNEDKGGTGT